MTPQHGPGAGAEAERPEYAGHYRLESCLGSGGMGVVHLARSTSGLKLAVKVVHAEFAKDPEFRGRFRQEVAAARRVSGAFTAPVVDADPEGERPWMATLFIPGPTLSEQVKRNGPMEPGQLRRLMAGLAEALRDIHRVGVVHRDLKPSNVLLAEDGPKVIDFGISLPKDSELRTETGKLIGTPPFMAPEQFRRPREVGPAADIFALGSVMVHAATGRGPFDSDSPYIVAYQVVHDEPDLTGVPENLAPLVLRCLAKEPEERPTPDELMRDLRSVAASYDTQAFIPAQRSGEVADAGEAGEAGAECVAEPGAASVPVQVPGSVSVPAVGRVRRRRRRMALVAGGIGLAVAGAGVSALLLGGGGAGPREAAPRTASTAFDAWRAKPAGAGEGTPQCAYGAGKLVCGRSRAVYALDPADGRLLWRHAVTGARWSGPPVVSGGLVQVVSGNGRHVAGLDPASGRTRWERDLSAYAGLGYTAHMLLLTHADGTLTGVDSASGAAKWQRRLPGSGVARVDSFAGDGLVYATTTSDDGGSSHVTAVDPASGAVRWEARLRGSLRPVGADGGAVFFLAADPVYGDTDAVLRYEPGKRASRRVKLPAPRADARAVVRGGVVYVLGAEGALDAVDVGAGRRVWHLETAVSRGSAPVVDGRYVYLAAADGRVIAVGVREGRFAGQTRAHVGGASDRVAAALPSPVVAGSHVFAGVADGTVFGVDAEPSDW
ncbi:serine/threonine-protein kinase [Streptomyces sp. L2]|uniref:serine/threonine-protein kinase n=1 Tax=Streptomyces sp. L2 TaxID=2162665 RepID=UPI0010134AF2|nr:serine/threonine-protein kinase [Streptomyces sp. L2]